MPNRSCIAAGLLAAALAAVPGGNAWGAEPEPAAPIEGKLIFRRPSSPVAPRAIRGPRIRMTIKEAVSLALARNFDITIEAHNPRIRAAELKREKSAFDPALVAGATANSSKIDSVSGFFNAGPTIDKQREITAGIEQRTMSGAQYSLVFRDLRQSSNNRFRGFDPSIGTRLTFTITQPLLKNFGFDVNKANIRIAAATLDQSLHTYRGRVIDVVNNVEQAYWDLVFANANLRFRKKSLELAKDLRRRNKIRVQVGTLAPIEILEAEATVASREETLIVAERGVKDREDALKKLLNITSDIPSWSIQLVPGDKAVFRRVRLNEMSLALKALQKRTDLRSAKLEIEKGQLEVKRAKRNLLPTLDLNGSAASDAIDNTRSNSINRLSGAKGYIIEGGVSLRIPIGNREARADLDGAKLRTRQARVRFDQLEQTIMEEVRRAVRRVRSDMKRVEATRIARKLAEERLDAQEKKLKVGLSTSRDVLEDQESLANALTNEEQALVDYQKGLANLDRVTHSTLQRFRIQLADPRKNLGTQSR